MLILTHFTPGTFLTASSASSCIMPLRGQAGVVST